jgi:phage terminase large subunit GpA-like protein
LNPPPRLRLSDWIERELRLPADVSALPGPVRLWPYQRETADAIGDPAVERVTVIKSARIGYTALITR